MWKNELMRFSIYRTCIAICTDGSCNNIYKNIDSFLDVCPYELTTFLDNLDEEPIESPSEVAVESDDAAVRLETSGTIVHSETFLGGTRVAQHYNLLEDKFIQKYFQTVNLKNVTFKE